MKMAEHHVRIDDKNEEYLKALQARTPFLSTYSDTLNYVVHMAERHRLM